MPSSNWLEPARDLPPTLLQGPAKMATGNRSRRNQPYISGEEPPQTLKEYDPEWARAF
jgi:hypothetical protein